MMCDTVETIPITVQWMSGDITIIHYTPNKSLYRLKQAILTAIQSNANPYRLSLYLKDEEDEWTYVTHTNYPSLFRKEAHFYAVMKDAIIHERLEYIYPLNGHDLYKYSLDGHDLWRFTYEDSDEHRVQISMAVCKNDGFCGMTEYREAKQNGQDIPWKYGVETFLRDYPIAEQSLTNMVQLWRNRRQ